MREREKQANRNRRQTNRDTNRQTDRQTDTTHPCGLQRPAQELEEAKRSDEALKIRSAEEFQNLQRMGQSAAQEVLRLQAELAAVKVRGLLLACYPGMCFVRFLLPVFALRYLFCLRF
jgi:hypothetical protein